MDRNHNIWVMIVKAWRWALSTCNTVYIHVSQLVLCIMLRPRRCFCCFNYLKSRDTDAYLTFLVFRFNHWNKKPFCSNNNNIKNSACKCQILCFYACIGAITCTQSIPYIFLKKHKSKVSTRYQHVFLSCIQYCNIAIFSSRITLND